MCAESLLYCVFPHGNPGEPGFGFCGEPAVWGRPYCQHHCSIAYIGHHERQRILSEIELETNDALQRLASTPDLTAEQLAAQ
jgi:GcrA cell cycle regulator